MPSTIEQGQATYILPHATKTHKESKRLHDQNKGIQEFIGGTLSFAPLERTTPKAILEIGCGAGDWAIQAAKTFPDSEVLAVDLSPIPERPLPQNMEFRSMDVTKSFPFEPETFDIVHARLVFFHLPKFEDVLSRTIQLVRPGGWLLLEDTDRTTHEISLGPGQKAFWDAFQKHAGNGEMKSAVGSAFEHLLKASDAFSEVNVKRVCTPLSRPNNGDADIITHNFHAMVKTSVDIFFQTVTEDPTTLNLTAELAKQAQDELKDPTRNVQLDFFFVWARKRV